MKQLYCFFTLIIYFFFNGNIHAQIVAGNAYMRGNLVEIGIAGAGGYEGVDTGISPVPAGMHFRSNTQYFGFVANPQMNAWAGSAYDGDFFTPGTPENGWGFEIISGGVSTKASNNRAGEYQIPTTGGFTYQTTGTCILVDHNSNYTGSGWDLDFHINYYLDINDLYYTTSVTVTNGGATTVPDFYYYRNFDPDNNITISGDYATTNTIVSQPGSGCNKAHISATSAVPWLSYVGMAGVGTNFRVARGGFSNRDGSDIWNGTGPMTGTLGSSVYSDEGIALAYRIQNLAPGASETFKFVIILDDAASNNAINNLFYFDYAGSIGGPPPECIPDTDTAISCAGSSVTISMMGSALSDFTWSWSPGTSLSTTTGTTVVASPTTTTTYTVTGTPTNPCFNAVTQTIVVFVDCSVLPVELLNYTATPNSNYVDLKWSTATEVNNDYFIIEKSADGINYQEINKVRSQHNSSSQSDYATIDQTPYNGLNYYKLTQVDMDGHREEIGIRTCYFVSGEEFVVDQVAVFDMSGKLILQKRYEGQDLFQLYNSINLNTGIYVIRLMDKNQNIKSQTLFKKMN